MLHEPVHQQLARLGLRGVSDTLARMSPATSSSTPSPPCSKPSACTATAWLRRGG